PRATRAAGTTSDVPAADSFCARVGDARKSAPKSTVVSNNPTRTASGEALIRLMDPTSQTYRTPLDVDRREHHGPVALHDPQLDAGAHRFQLTHRLQLLGRGRDVPVQRLAPGACADAADV